MQCSPHATQFLFVPGAIGLDTCNGIMVSTARSSIKHVDDCIGRQ